MVVFASVFMEGEAHLEGSGTGMVEDIINGFVGDPVEDDGFVAGVVSA